MDEKDKKAKQKKDEAAVQAELEQQLRDLGVGVNELKDTVNDAFRHGFEGRGDELGRQVNDVAGGHPADDVHPAIGGQVLADQLDLAGIAAVQAVVHGDAPPQPHTTAGRLRRGACLRIGPGLLEPDQSLGRVGPAGEHFAVQPPVGGFQLHRYRQDFFGAEARDLRLFIGADARVPRKDAVHPVVDRQVRKGRQRRGPPVGFQGGQPGVQRAPQLLVPGDKGIDLHPGGLEHPGALPQERGVQAGLGPGVKVVDGDHLRPGGGQRGGLGGGGGGGVDRDGHPGGQGAGFVQRKAVVQPQPPQPQRPGQLGGIVQPEQGGGHFGHIRQDAPALPAQPAAHGPRPAGIAGAKLLPDVQGDENRRTACRAGGKRCFLFLKLCQVDRPCEKVRHRLPPRA